jgi:hypothetical protein
MVFDAAMRRAPYHTEYLVSLAQEQLGEIGAVLAGDPGDECCFHASIP